MDENLLDLTSPMNLYLNSNRTHGFTWAGSMLCRLQFLFRKWGGSIRWCLRYPEEPLNSEQMESAISSCDLKDVVRFMSDFEGKPNPVRVLLFTLS